MTGQPNGNGAMPVANRAVVQGELKRARRHGRNANTVLLLRAASQWRDDETFTADLGDTQAEVTVRACPTVLAVLDAMSTERADGTYLVVLTPCETGEIGQSLLAHAIEPEVKPINRWDLVQDAFGIRHLDPLLTRSRYSWLPEALLDAQPVGGWRRLNGTALTFATAMNRLVSMRLGRHGDEDEIVVDAAALLEWTTEPAAVSSFLRLRETERRGIIDWLHDTIRAVAEVLFAISPDDRITDAVPLGLAIDALYREAAGQSPPTGAPVARARAEERFFTGKTPASAAMREFGEAAVSFITRWTANGHAQQAADMCDRAERILHDLQADEIARESPVLDAGLDARLVTVARALAKSSITDAQAALASVLDHKQARNREAEITAAQAGVRVLRWLATPEDTPVTLADGATLMLRSWAWADRAISAIGRPAASRVPELAAAYAALSAAARQRRARLDEAFARKLSAWTQGSAVTTDLLLVENLLERVARPLAGHRLPLIIVLDGMSATVGAQIAEQVTARGHWLEVGRREDGREPALATVPSVTSISRTSLLSGTLRSGGQSEERAGFTAFWGRRKARLFHKGDLGPDPGETLAAPVRAAVTDPDTVVGVVLNTIDDALDKGKPGDVSWLATEVRYLTGILDEARRAGRPVILTADHGHVLDQGQPPADGASDSARFRTGVPGPGEIAVKGPRVLAGGGEVVAAVDDGIHYTPRKAGYHGGASPAEVVVPVIVLLPPSSLKPPGWYEYEPSGHAPAWWDVTPGPITREEPARPLSPRRRRVPVPPSAMETLFGEITPIGSGVRVVASPRVAEQRKLARRAPADDQIARLIDGLITAGGRLTIAEVAAITGEPTVRMAGYIAQVARLLNVDGYRVLGTADGNRTVELNIELLSQQFLGG
ncbi:MAG: BREX-2 system phosphatase PglZ [Streptosporangiaceae bacterium]